MLADSISKAENLRDNILSLSNGKYQLTLRNPNEFDYYMVALELLKSDLSTSRYFIFPVNPNSMTYDNQALTKISKTAGGISVLKSSQFEPRDLTLSGNFGRNFKVLIGSTWQDTLSSFRELDTSNVKSTIGGILNSFSANVKTGYGCTKVVEEILEKSKQRDEFGGSHFLVLYNLAFNQRFFVEYENKSFSQSLESNMIWNYSLKFKVIGHVDNFLKAKMNVKTNDQLVTDNYIQKQANHVQTKVNNVLKKLF